MFERMAVRTPAARSPEAHRTITGEGCAQLRLSSSTTRSSPPAARGLGEGKLLASELSERLNVSEDTIRRDLREMARGQQLQRVHGGALPRNPAPPYATRTRQATEAKSAIAEAAARLVQDG